MSSFAVGSTLEKMGKSDKDFRYMATLDLQAEMQNEGFKLDQASEVRIVAAILKQLNDSSKDVQGLTVQCLGPLANNVREAQLTTLLDALGNNIMTGSEELRDISALGLTNIINEIKPSDVTPHVYNKAAATLIQALGHDKPEVGLRSLDVARPLLIRFGAQLDRYHTQFQAALLPLLSHARPAVRKHAVDAIGLLAAVSSDKLFQQLIQHLTTSLEKPGKNVRTLVQTVEVVTKFVGYKLGAHLDTLFPLVARSCGDAESREQDEETVELTESCVQAFASFLLRCPKETTPFIEQIVDTCLAFIKFDPNYASDAEAGSDEEEDGGGSDEDDEMSDDEDMSWKVRKAAARCLGAAITTRPGMLGRFYEVVAPVLVQRFKEREENVKADIFATFVELLRQTRVAENAAIATGGDHVVRLLEGAVPSIVGGLEKQLSAKSQRTREGAITVFQELARVLPGSLASHVGALVPGIVHSLDEKSSDNNLKMKASHFVRTLLSTHPPAVFYPHITALSTPIIRLVSDEYYKTAAEALRVVSEIVRVLRPSESAPAAAGIDSRAVVEPLYKCVIASLTAKDIDQEVKKCAIRALGVIIARFGDLLRGEVGAALPIVLACLRNEITRVTAVKGFATIAASALHVDIGAILSDAVGDLASFLRKSNRALKEHSLTCLKSLVDNYGAGISAELYGAIITESATLVNDQDLHIAYLALALDLAVMAKFSGAPAIVKAQVLPAVYALLSSALLQGQALTAVTALLVSLVKAGAIPFRDVFKAATEPARGAGLDFPKQAFSSTAQAIAAVLVEADPSGLSATVTQFADDAVGSNQGMAFLALYCLGEIGARTDLSGHDKVRTVVLEAFDAPAEQLKSAASFALGNLAVGSMSTYLPFVLDQLRTQPARQYLLLQSLRELIAKQASNERGLAALRTSSKDIWDLLFTHCESDEEGTRNVVAECLGRLTAAEPATLIPALKDRVASASPHARSTIVTAVKFTFVESSAAVDALLADVMPSFLALIGDADLHVRRAAVNTLNYAAHNKASLVRGPLPEFLPLIYAETAIKAELIQIVDLGPFKHKVDHGIENRKAAFECMYTLLDTCLDRISPHEFVERVVEGLRDTEPEVKVQCHRMLDRLAVSTPAAVLEMLDAMVDAFKVTITSKPKEGAVAHEIERNNETIASSMRAIYYLRKVPSSDTCLKWEDFVRSSLQENKPLKEKYDKVVAAMEATQQPVADA